MSGPGATDLLGDFGSAADDFNPRGFDSSSTAPAANGRHENIIVSSLCLLHFYYPVLFFFVICELCLLLQLAVLMQMATLEISLSFRVHNLNSGRLHTTIYCNIIITPSVVD